MRSSADDDAAEAGGALDEALQQLRQQVAERDDLLAIAAHELRNPLHTLMLQLALARNAAAAADVATAAERLDKAQASLGRYAERVTLLLDLARLNAQGYPLDLRPLDLCTLLRDVVEAQKAEAQFRGVGVALSLPAGSCEALMDGMVFEQIVVNLMQNTFKHSGAATLSVALQLRDAGWAHLSVADDGRGISAEDQARVFHKFRVARGTERGQGSGLGLWIVSKLVDALGGTIALDSRPGTGCAFRLKLPLRRTPESS